MIRTPFRVEAPTGGIIRGEVRLPEDSPPRAAILLVHGFKGSKDRGFFPYVAGELAHRGWAAVTFNFSGSGIREDPYRVTDLEAFARNTFTRELDELLWMVELVHRGDLSPREPEAIGLLGYSRGSADALLTARESPLVHVLATWGSVDHLDRWDPETVEHWRREGRVHVPDEETGRKLPLERIVLEDYLDHRERLDLERGARELRIPWLLVHGDEDATVAVEEARRLARWSPVARLVVVEGAGHRFQATQPFQGTTPELEKALEATVAHFRRHLPPG